MYLENDTPIWSDILDGFVRGFFFNLKFFLIDNYFLAVLSLHCCMLALSSCFEQGLLSIAVASLIVEHRL